MVLNLDRVGYRRSVEMARALSATSNCEPLGRAWADAMAIDEVEVEEIKFKIDSARQLARAKAKLGF